jgi:hypothetical protein
MEPKFSPQDHQAALSYMQNWFWSRAWLEKAANISSSTLDEMIQAGCVPGVIYRARDDGHWWSALAAYTGKADALSPKRQKGERDWYSPASLWWARRTLCYTREGHTLSEAAALNVEQFERSFAENIGTVRYANLAYPDCFGEAGKLIEGVVHTTARSEWAAWISGAYGVCLRDFSARSCITKEALAAAIKRYFAHDDKNLSRLDIVIMCQELAALITPFAPWERAQGTPGTTIDVALHRFDLGEDFAYSHGRVAS